MSTVYSCSIDTIFLCAFKDLKENGTPKYLSNDLRRCARPTLRPRARPRVRLSARPRVGLRARVGLSLRVRVRRVRACVTAAAWMRRMRETYPEP